MRTILIYSFRFLIILSFICFNSYKVYGTEIETLLEQLTILQKDIKTLEKAVYSQDTKGHKLNLDTSGTDSDVLTKHLLKLSEIEEQFKILTNNFEEINFKLDKLSNRITKIQTDNQLRFQDIEKSGMTKSGSFVVDEQKKLPGSGEAKDLGGISDADIEAAVKVQKTQSIESVGTVITEDTARIEKILP